MTSLQRTCTAFKSYICLQLSTSQDAFFSWHQSTPNNTILYQFNYWAIAKITNYPLHIKWINVYKSITKNTKHWFEQQVLTVTVIVVSVIVVFTGHGCTNSSYSCISIELNLQVTNCASVHFYFLALT